MQQYMLQFFVLNKINLLFSKEELVKWTTLYLFASFYEVIIVEVPLCSCFVSSVVVH